MAFDGSRLRAQGTRIYILCQMKWSMVRRTSTFPRCWMHAWISQNGKKLTVSFCFWGVFFLRTVVVSRDLNFCSHCYSSCYVTNRNWPIYINSLPFLLPTAYNMHHGPEMVPPSWGPPLHQRLWGKVFRTLVFLPHTSFLQSPALAPFLPRLLIAEAVMEL